MRTTRTKGRKRAAVIGLAFVSTSLLAGCGDDGGSDDAGGDGTLSVSLSEWSVEATGSPAAGTVEVTANNEGGETHELVIVRADSVEGWEQDERGFVLEDQFAESDLIGEIEEFEAGTAETASFELTAGTYILFCNIVEEESDGTWESHFNEGMVTTVSVS